MDAAEIARLRNDIDLGFGIATSKALAILDALEQTRKEVERHPANIDAIRNAKDADLREMRAQRDAALMERLDEDHLADLIAERDVAQQDAKEARALIEDIKQWAGQRCPCDNDEPKICPLCSADVSTDRCMAVDVSFPRAIRARIEAMLEKKL